ncbi:FAD-dependent oxidoreductase [Candidatus Kaiserbacteria bacterium]|nr:FAD-dependent oxidoreductase [Candidatus Kaiserbacteria bacterium]
MNPIKQLAGTITRVRELSPSAREYTITPSEPFPFTAGAFVNTFFEHNGKTIRRAFSISSSDSDTNTFTLSIRLSLQGELTPLLWERDFTGETIKLMGPLGLNTADKMQAKKIYLFGFGVGAGVVKSLADHMMRRSELVSLTLVTGNRTIEEILHKDYFDIIATDPRVTVKYVVSDTNQTIYPDGYIQNHIRDYDFNNADIYICGQGVACNALQTVIANHQPRNCQFFIEDFH